MWIGPALSSAATMLFLTLNRPGLLVAAGPLLGLWLISPRLSPGGWSRAPGPRAPVHLSRQAACYLQKLSRRTWRFFEVFVTSEDNWLPPDNVQEHSGQVVASRTSPTNIGMALLANLAACDFGYCSANSLLDRTQKTLATLARMERHRGHFYNWYDTRSLEPLHPLYVSTVDSGNLVGPLLVLHGGLLELIESKLLPIRLFGGLLDTVRVLLDVARGLHRPAEEGKTPLVAEDVLSKIEGLEKDLENHPCALSASVAFLKRLAVAGSEITAAAGANGELLWWASAFERSCVEHRDDLLNIAPWAKLPTLPAPPLPEDAQRQGTPEQIERLSKLREMLARLDAVPTLRAVAALQESFLPSLDAILSEPWRKTADVRPDHALAAEWHKLLRRAIADSSRSMPARRIKEVEHLARQCQELADMDFSFLFDKSRDLFAIGYNVSDHRLDNSFYDLLASEARLASFIMIAQGHLGQEHWFALGRMLTSTGGALHAAQSWSGSMFEYLMPLLVMPTYENTLLDQTYKAVVRRQIKYGRQLGVPWGMSESGYNRIDLHVHYSVPSIRGSGAGAGSRGLARRTSSSRRVRHASRPGCSAECMCAGTWSCLSERARRPVRPVRGHRLHALPPPPGATKRHRCVSSWPTTRE